MNILLVEGHADTLGMLVRLLGRRGHAVTPAATLAEARAALASGPRPDVALAELWLPDGDGAELGPDLAAVGVPAVVVSTQTYPADVARSLAAGFAAHLAKPVAVDELMAAVTAAVARGPVAPP